MAIPVLTPVVVIGVFCAIISGVVDCSGPVFGLVSGCAGLLGFSVITTVTVLGFIMLLLTMVVVCIINGQCMRCSMSWRVKVGWREDGML